MSIDIDTQLAAAAPTRCFHCGLPVEEPERRVISRARGFYAHLTPSCCAIATIQARKTAQGAV